MPSSEYNKSERKQDQAKKQADDFRGLLESSFFDMNNKETMVAEMLLNYYIFYTGKVLDSEREKSAKAFAAQMIKNHGYEAEEGYKFNNIVNNTIRDYKDYYYNDFDVILAGDDNFPCPDIPHRMVRTSVAEFKLICFRAI